MENQQPQAVFNIYCDESRNTSDKSDRYAVIGVFIGALCCPRDKKYQIVHDIHLLKKYTTQGEFGWSKALEGFLWLKVFKYRISFN